MMEEDLVELKDFKISHHALQSIVRLAVEEIEGLLLAQGLITGISQRLHVPGAERPLRIEIEDSEVEIGLNVRIDYGLSIPQVVHELQFRVKGAVESMTGLKVRNINVAVEGINFNRD